MISVIKLLINIALWKYYNECIKMICADGLKRRCYLILIGVIVDYKEQVLIIGIKTNVQCFVCYIPPQE